MPNRRARRAASRPKWGYTTLTVIIAVLIVGLTGLIFYPATASWFSAVAESSNIAKYGLTDSAGPSASTEQAVRDAQAYNTALSRGAIQVQGRVPGAATSREPVGFSYENMLHGNSLGLMSRIVIPKIGVDLPVYHGTSDATLKEGVGHLEGSSLPVGGRGTHTVLAAHRGLSSATLFTNLDQVTVGDTFTLYTFGLVMNYRVVDVKVVEPDDSRSLEIVSSKDLATLVTCTPLGINSQRILVTGERVLPTPDSAIAAGKKAPAGPGFPWWALGLAVGVFVAITYVWWAGRPVRTRSSADSSSTPTEVSHHV